MSKKNQPPTSPPRRALQARHPSGARPSTADRCTPPARGFDPWEFLGGAKFATILLLFWALVASIGTFLPQGKEPAEYQEMLGAPWANVAMALGLDHMYYTPWFLALLGLLCVNLTLSIVNRVKRLRREDRAVKVECPSSGLAKIAEKVRLPEPIAEAAERVEKALRGMGLGVRRATAGDEVSFYAERGRWRRWGSTWTHVGFLVIFLGALLGHWPGLGYNGYLTILEGRTQGVAQGEGGRPTGLMLKVHDFQVVGDRQGRPRDFACDIELFDEGRSIERKTIRVNTPLEYGSVTFYQAGYGMTGFHLAITDPRGGKTNQAVATGPQGEMDPTSGLVTLGKGRPSYFVRQFFPHAKECEDHGGFEPVSALPVAPAAEVFENPNFEASPDDWRPLGWLVPGRPVKGSDGSQVELASLSLFTGIQYRKDIGYPVVALGFLVSTLGLLLSFYVGHRRVRVALAPAPGGTTVYVAGIPGPPGCDAGSIPERLIERLEHAEAPAAPPTRQRTRRSEHAPA